VDVATGKVAIALSDSQHNLWNPYYSRDDKWVGFLMEIGADQQRYRIYVAPAKNFVPVAPDRWVQLTTGEYYDDKEQFSTDRSTKYVTSNRDDPHDSGAKNPASAGAAAQRESALCGEGMARYPQMRLCLLQPGDRRPVEKLVAWLKKVVPQGELHDVTAYLPPRSHQDGLLLRNP